MIVSPVAYRYARSLIQLAAEKGEVDAVRDDMQLVAGTCAASLDLRVMLKSPVVTPDKKQKVLGRVFGGKIGRMTERFIDILVRKGRENLMQQVAQAYQQVYREMHDILLAEVQSATPLNQEARTQVREMVHQRHPDKQIVLAEVINPELIGGAIIRVGDEQVDTSVSRRLNDLRRRFSDNPFNPSL